MKKVYTLITALMLAIAAGAQTQTLNVKVGCVTYQFPTALTGEMTYNNNSSTLTIMGNDLTTGDIDEMAVAARGKNSDNTVNVSYSDVTPAVTIAEEQWADAGSIDENISNQPLFNSSISGIRLNFQMDGVTHVEVESVDAYPIASGSYPSILPMRPLRRLSAVDIQGRKGGSLLRSSPSGGGRQTDYAPRPRRERAGV